MVIAQGDIWWADFGIPHGSEPGFRRPVIIVQSDELNRSRLATVIVVPLTSQLRWANSPGNVLLPPRSSGLARPSVANPTQLVSIDRSRLIGRVGRLARSRLHDVLDGIDLVLGRDR